jgi:RHS repeat-associated protein
MSSAVLVSFVCTQVIGMLPQSAMAATEASGSAVVTLRKLPTLYLSTDALGSTTLVTQNTLEASGGYYTEVVEKRAYDAFGLRRNPNWSSADVYGQILPSRVDQGYTAQVEDFESDTIHMGGRTYDPKLGRFTSADRFVDGMNPTQRWNRYKYVSNNPLALTDPSGFIEAEEGTEVPKTDNPTISIGTGYTSPGQPPQSPQPAQGSQSSKKGGSPSTQDQGSNTTSGGNAGGGGNTSGVKGEGYGGGGNYSKSHSDSPSRAEQEESAHNTKESLAQNAREQRGREGAFDKGGVRQENSFVGMSVTGDLHPVASTPELMGLAQALPRIIIHVFVLGAGWVMSQMSKPRDKAGDPPKPGSAQPTTADADDGYTDLDDEADVRARRRENEEVVRRLDQLQDEMIEAAQKGDMQRYEIAKRAREILIKSRGNGM